MGSKRFEMWSILLSMVLLFFAAALVAAVCFVAIKTAVPAMEQTALNVIVYTVQFVCAIAGVAVYCRRKGIGKPVFRSGIRLSDAPLTLSGILLVATAGIVLEPVLILFPEHYFESMGEMIGSGGMAILFSVVLVPVCEELFFRGLVLEQTSRRWGALSAVTVSALFFGAVHLPNLPQTVNAFAMGIVMGYIYVLTRSLVPVTVIHAVNNAVAYLQLQMSGDELVTLRRTVGNETLYWGIYATGAVILAGSLVWMAEAARAKSMAARVAEMAGIDGTRNKTDEISLNENNE